MSTSCGYCDVKNPMKTTPVFMPFPQPLHAATYLDRKQRFLAEMTLADGTHELVYCANSGAMTARLSSGMRALIWDSEDLKRKRRFTWRAIETEGLWVGTDTHLSNRIVEQAMILGLVPGLESYDRIVREPLVEPGVRVDFLISGALGDCLIEVKSANIVDHGVARYPDSATPRGVKQLNSLARKAAQGKRAILVFLVQREDARCFQISTTVDAAYAAAFAAAMASGVEVLALGVSVTPDGFGIPNLLSLVSAAPADVVPAIEMSPSLIGPTRKNGKNGHG